MRIRIIRSFVEGFHVYNPGDEPELDHGKTVELVKMGVAEPLRPTVETAVSPEPETAVRLNDRGGSRRGLRPVATR